MESSFVLLSSMSPKVNIGSKTYKPKTVPRLLALKRNIRRSSNSYNLPHSDSLVLIESSTTESIDTESSHAESHINTTPIVISDSEDNASITENIRSSLQYYQSKLVAIEDWVKDVNLQSDTLEHTPQISCDNLTLNKFDQLYNFSDVANNLPKDGSDNCNLGVCNSLSESTTLSDSETTDSSNKSHTQILDELYDKTWRNLKYDILPKSLPSKKKLSRNLQLPKTDIKIKTQKNNLISPWAKRFQNICNSDTSEDSVVKDRNPLAVRLSFNSDEEDSDSNSRSTSTSRSNCSETLDDKTNRNVIKKTTTKLPKKNLQKPQTVTKKINSKTSKTVGNKIDIVDNKDQPKKLPKKVKNTDLTKKIVSLNTNNVQECIRKDTFSDTIKNYACKSFLASLSENVKLTQCDPSARLFRNNFQDYKHELLTRLFKLYNEEVFDNKICDDTPLEWNIKMRGSAGYCYCRKITKRTGVIERKARIVLSTKVIDSCDRLRDTLIHEMCHAATWIVNQVANGHGDYWKAWTNKARRIFPELPTIKRCHDYVINTKYTYKCTDCGYSIGRHSKSLDIERKRCGYCYGKFEVFINKKSKDGETKSVPVTPKKAPSGFALFVKENYAIYRTPRLNHGQVMKLLGEKFSEMKVLT